MACQRCTKKLSSRKEQVVCQRYCGVMFHAVCVNVNGPLQQHLASTAKNLFWMCDGCAGLFTNMHFRSMMTKFDDHSSAASAAFSTMQSEIEKLQETVNALAAKTEEKLNTPTPFATPTMWPNKNRLNTPHSAVKRRRVNDGDSVSIPKAPGNVGTKALGVIKTVQLDQRDDENLLWLYLSAFNPKTSESQIASFVKECLDMTEIQPKVVKLVPKGTDLNSLRFVSFKVGLGEQFREKALASESWPENIRFREFEDYRSKNGPRIVSLLPTIPPENQPPLLMDVVDSPLNQ